MNNFFKLNFFRTAAHAAAAFAFVAASALCGAQTRDADLLDTLVGRKILTDSEALAIAKESSRIGTVQSCAKSVRIYCRTQTQYSYLYSSDNESGGLSKAVDTFAMRRIFLGFWSDINEDWHLRLTLDLACLSEAQNLIAVTYIQKKYETNFAKGSFYFGNRTDVFVYEDTVTTASLLTIEKSPVTRFFAYSASSRAASQGGRSYCGSLGFGSYLMGAYADAKFRGLDNFDFMFAATNSENSNFDYSTITNNIPNLWLSGKWRKNCGETNIAIGCMTGYGAAANKFVADGSTAPIMGINPYVNLNWQAVTFWADYVAARVEDAPYIGQNAVPQGFDIAAEYRFCIGQFGELGAVFRYSKLWTNGLGTRINDAVRLGANMRSGAGAYYDDAECFYGGLNWYIDGDTVKLQAGFELTRLDDNLDAQTLPTASSADVYGFRMQFQLIF